MATLKIMTPKHPKWEEFIEILAGERGCNFIEKEPDTPESSASFTWTCDNSTDRPFATAILTEMGGIDIEKTLQYFDAAGGHCDCEIVFNVDSPLSV